MSVSSGQKKFRVCTAFTKNRNLPAVCFRVKALLTQRPPHRSVREAFPHTVPRFQPFLPNGIKGRSSDSQIYLLPKASIRAPRRFAVLSSRIRSPSRTQCSVFSISRPRSSLVLASPNNIARFGPVLFFFAFRQSITR